MNWDIAIITNLLGHLVCQQQDFVLAKERYRESLKEPRVFGSPTNIAWCLEGCAAVLSAEGHAVPAARISAAAANFRRQASTPLPNEERETHEQIVEKTRNFLGKTAFMQEWTIGAGFTQDQAIEMVLLEFE